MARPKKVSTTDMLRILDSYMEKQGDASKLKCSNLEKYAATLGISVKAYDFRRDKSVRCRIDEITAGARNSKAGALVYKNLDADALIANHPTKATLKAALLELDANWRRVYEHSVFIASENTSLISENNSKKQMISELAEEISGAHNEITSLKRTLSEQQLEIRYLKSVVETYLYPALANKLLQCEGMLTSVDMELVNAAAISDMTETDSLIPFTEAIAPDQELLLREQRLFDLMKSQMVKGGGNDE